MNSKSYISKRRLRAQREAAGLTQQKLAQLIGQDIEYILGFEQGAQEITATELWRLCQALKAPPHRLIDIEKSK